MEWDTQRITTISWPHHLIPNLYNREGIRKETSEAREFAVLYQGCTQGSPGSLVYQMHVSSSSKEVRSPNCRRGWGGLNHVPLKKSPVKVNLGCQLDWIEGCLEN
jgi:hypothetical protein